MSDALPVYYGVNLAAADRRGHMLPDARRAHERLASLPTQRHYKPDPTAQLARERSERAAETTRRNGTQVRGPAPLVMPAGDTYVRLKPSIDASSPARPPRKKRTTGGISQRLAVLEALRRGPMTVNELRAAVGSDRVSARVSELREQGHDIEIERVITNTGAHTRYRLRGSHA